MRAAALLFAFATLCFAVGYVVAAFFLLRDVEGTPVLHTLFQPRRRGSGYVLKRSYLLPPAVLAADAPISRRVRRLYEALRVNAYGVIFGAVLTGIAVAVQALM